MESVKITIALIIAILLQWTLRNVAEPFAYIDFPLIIVVYAALQRNSIKAILFGTIAGIAVDALSGGLLGANGFSKTLDRIYSFRDRAACLHGQPSAPDTRHSRSVFAGRSCLLRDCIACSARNRPCPCSLSSAYSLIGTTIAGTLVYLLLQTLC